MAPVITTSTEYIHIHDILSPNNSYFKNYRIIGDDRNSYAVFWGLKFETKAFNLNEKARIGMYRAQVEIGAGSKCSVYLVWYICKHGRSLIRSATY